MTRIAIVEEMKTILVESLHESKLKDEMNKQKVVRPGRNDKTW